MKSFTLQCISHMYGDCTYKYAIHFTEEITLGKFIDQIPSNEYGNITIHYNGTETIIYSYESNAIKQIDAIAELLNCMIDVNSNNYASGNYGRIDYILTLKTKTYHNRKLF